MTASDELDPQEAEELEGRAVMGQQFENVDPLLLGEENGTGKGSKKKQIQERVPVDPAADEAYEELVDRLVQFNYSNRKKWFQFWK